MSWYSHSIVWLITGVWNNPYSRYKNHPILIVAYKDLKNVELNSFIAPKYRKQINIDYKKRGTHTKYLYPQKGNNKEWMKSFKKSEKQISNLVGTKIKWKRKEVHKWKDMSLKQSVNCFIIIIILQQSSTQQSMILKDQNTRTIQYGSNAQGVYPKQYTSRMEKTRIMQESSKKFRRK